MNLIEGLSREIARVVELRMQYESTRGPGVLVEPQIRMMNNTIEAAHVAMGGGDIVQMMQAFEALKGWQG